MKCLIRGHNKCIAVQSQTLSSRSLRYKWSNIIHRRTRPIKLLAVLFPLFRGSIHAAWPLKYYADGEGLQRGVAWFYVYYNFDGFGSISNQLVFFLKRSFEFWMEILSSENNYFENFYWTITTYCLKWNISYTWGYFIGHVLTGLFSLRVFYLYFKFRKFSHLFISIHGH